MRDLIKVFKALSDETRLRVFNLLLERECCVCEVMQSLEISASKASRNLTTLYDAGFLKMRKDGLWSLYSFDWDGMDITLRGILAITRQAIQIKEQMMQDRERLRTAARIGPCCKNEPKVQ